MYTANPELNILLTTIPNILLTVPFKNLLKLTWESWGFLSILGGLGSVVLFALPLSKQPAPPSDRENFHTRQKFLTAVYKEITERLHQSLHNAVLINLLKQEVNLEEEVRPNIDVKIAKTPSFQLTTEDSIIKIFDQADGKLLILGSAGSGKTTIMLELALKLWERANKDTSAPVPVIFDIGSWKNQKQSLDKWLIEQLKIKYYLHQSIGQQWLEYGNLLLLIDGIDELHQAEQEKCLQAINQLLYSSDNPPYIALSTRFNAYKKCQSRLKFKAAVLLRPLEKAQIKQYLFQSRSRELWYNIESETQLLEIAKNPLMLSMMTLAYEEILIHSWRRILEKEEQRQYVLNAYIRRQLGRDINPRKQPTPEKARKWLTWLAKTMEANQQTEISPQLLPPEWLENSSEKNIYQLMQMLNKNIPVVQKIANFLVHLILWRKGYIPWNYTRFLNYASQQSFLQKTGNRYRFQHKILQNHFSQIAE